MAALLRWTKNLLRRAPLQPLQFPASGFDVVPDHYKLEEENHPKFKEGLYFPVSIGQIFDTRYQVVGKLGYGVSSTVWLARDLHAHEHVALKVLTRDDANVDRMKVYDRLKSGPRKHLGYGRINQVLHSFVVPRAGGDHHCLVMKPMWDTLNDILLRNPARRFTPALLKGTLIFIFQALDYLHTECKLIHTDIKGDNVLYKIVDPSILDTFTSAEMNEPAPRKDADGVTIYASRGFERPKSIGDIVLSDFGEAVSGEKPWQCRAQPEVYRAPEVVLGATWSYPVDIWNVGALVWDLFEGKRMFSGRDTNDEYGAGIHLAEMIAILGMPPVDLLRRGKKSHEYFTEDGQWTADIPIPGHRSLEMSEEFLEGERKEMFLRFMRSMLQWRPEDRKTAKELLADTWLSAEWTPEDHQL